MGSTPPLFQSKSAGAVRTARRHRFMEAADFNAVFRLLFEPLRDNVRRGMSCDGQAYGIEMDARVPGRMLATVWIPPAARGFASPALLDDARRRRALYDGLLAEPRPESLFAWLCERRAEGSRPACLYLEIVGEDAAFAAEYARERGRGWHQRELLDAPHRRIDLRTLG
jgi:hypothetical protein